MEIEMAPQLGDEQLDGGIERGRGGHREREGHGVWGVDVVEMHNLGIALDGIPDHIGDGNDHQEDEENDEMAVGEDGDETRDGVVGVDIGQQL